MSTELRSMATMSALIRTAEWGVSNARESHRAAMLEHAAHETENESAKTSAEQAQQFTRELLGRSTFSADLLSVATVNQALVNDEVERTKRVLSEASQRLADAHQKLTQARITLQLYQRLRERKAMLHRQDAHRRAQRDQDDAGTTLKIYENSTVAKLTEQEIANGY